MRVNSPGAPDLDGGGRGEDLGIEKAPVAEPDEPSDPELSGPSGGGAFGLQRRPFGLPNIWVNSPGSLAGRPVGDRQSACSPRVAADCRPRADAWEIGRNRVKDSH